MPKYVHQAMDTDEMEASKAQEPQRLSGWSLQLELAVAGTGWILGIGVPYRIAKANRVADSRTPQVACQPVTGSAQQFLTSTIFRMMASEESGLYEKYQEKWKRLGRNSPITSETIDGLWEEARVPLTAPPSYWATPPRLLKTAPAVIKVACYYVRIFGEIKETPHHKMFAQASLTTSYKNVSLGEYQHCDRPQ
ncbi:hypothetical protein J6590_039991 [Homalodisca vitripennis]|nr:hypothetical protein J6590_039991 [Homalodisca vitripennis]